MSTKSRRKGRTAEQELVRLGREHGLSAVRTWTCAQNFDPSVRACDLTIESLPHQAKIKAKGFKFLYDGLQYVSGLILRRDRDEWLVCIRLSLYLQLLRAFFRDRSAAETGDTTKVLKLESMASEQHLT